MSPLTLVSEKHISLLESEVYVNYGKLLEDQLLKWQGGSHHVRGIAEYITNSDDSYRRLNKYHKQEIVVEIHSKSGRKIDKLLIIDKAEGMSFVDLESKFFRYFESHSGREQGMNVSGQFGTGGKAYAIMNFKQCFITSVKNGLENKAWFKWDFESKKIIKGYNLNGYRDRKIDKEDGTIVELIRCHKNNLDLTDFVVRLNSLARIRHVIKSQIVCVKLFQKSNQLQELILEYDGPSDKSAFDKWEFQLPKNLQNTIPDENVLKIRYFERPIGENAFIDISDGITSVADTEVSKIDGRPFSKYINGEVIIRKLQNSTAVKENRKGLEEYDDLTIEIQLFLKQSIEQVINVIQERQRKKEKDRIIEVSNEKIKELNKFLNKCELNFHQEISKLRQVSREQLGDSQSESDGDTDQMDYRHTNENDNVDDFVKGEWGHGNKGHGGGGDGGSKFNPKEDGNENAILDNAKSNSTEPKKNKRGLVVLMSDSSGIPDSERPVFSQYEEPVVDRDMQTKGIIWINANNPIIVKYREKKESEELFKEAVANYVLLVVAQYQAQRILDMQSEDERDDPMTLFRQKYFELQNLLREDSEISYFSENESAIQN